MRRRWTPQRIADESVRLNRMIDGGFVTITAHPIFNQGRWVVRIETVAGKDALVIGTDTYIHEAIAQAWSWIEAHRPAIDAEVVRIEGAKIG